MLNRNSCRWNLIILGDLSVRLNNWQLRLRFCGVKSQEILNLSLTFQQLKMIEGEERSSAAGKEDDVSAFFFMIH